MTILKGSFGAYRDYIAAHAGDGVWALCFDGEEAQLPVPAISYGKEGDGISEAHNLFTVLRELDRKVPKPFMPAARSAMAFPWPCITA